MYLQVNEKYHHFSQLTYIVLKPFCKVTKQFINLNT